MLKVNMLAGGYSIVSKFHPRASAPPLSNKPWRHVFDQTVLELMGKLSIGWAACQGCPFKPLNYSAALKANYILYVKLTIAVLPISHTALVNDLFRQRGSTKPFYLTIQS